MHKSFQNFKYKKKTIFKKSENGDPENNIILIALPSVAPLENLKQSIKEERIYAIYYYIKCLN